jgi:hypothetical protein
MGVNQMVTNSSKYQDKCHGQGAGRSAAKVLAEGGGERWQADLKHYGKLQILRKILQMQQMRH